MVFIFLLPTAHTLAQDKGNVSIHTDPRLAVLLRNTKTIEPVITEAADNGAVRKVKTKKIIAEPKKTANTPADIAIAPAKVKKVKEPKYIYNPDDHLPPPEKTGNGTTVAKEDEEERTAYKKARDAERTAAANDKSSEDEIKEFRETREKERGTKGASKKIGKTGITADEVRYLTPTVSGTSRGGRYNGTGFRVQIYYGTNRYEAMRRKAEFMRHYPGVPTYFSYASPTYKVKVGDYRRHDDALSMFREANGSYSPCMIVPDVVAIH